MIKGVVIDKPFHKNRVYIKGRQISWKKSMEYVRIGKTGFNWGYCGAGPQQLSFAILLELTNEKVAYSLYYTFTEKFIAKFPHKKNFEVSEKDAMKVIKLCLKEPCFPLYTPHAIKNKKWN